MNLRAFFLLWIVLPLLATTACGQKLEKITHLRLEYWRSFHGEIVQEVFVYHSGKIELRTTVQSPRNDFEAIPFVKIITAEDLAPVLEFCNDMEARQFFARTEPVIQMDGSALTVKVTQNSFSITFASKEAFGKKAAPALAALGRAAQTLFKLAEVTIPEDALY